MNEVTLSSHGIKVPVRVFQDFAAGAIYFAFYVGPVTEPLNVCAELLKDPSLFERLHHKAPAYLLKVSAPYEVAVNTATLRFTGRVYIYSENHITEDALSALMAFASERNLFVQYRGLRWAENRASLEKPLAFISHDWRDKEMAADLAQALVLRTIPVWFSEYSLKVGDSLRESIEKGLKECRRCILLLSPNYLSNPGWTKTEFTSVFTRELLENTNIFLPIWAGVSKKQVYEYCPTLADRVALPIELGIEVIGQRLAAAIRPAA